MSYPFESRAAEDERLIVQGRLLDPLTRRVLVQAGLEPGMRVLDLGSGAGNMSRLAADLVGASGSVVGVEKDPHAIELARRRTDQANVEYRVGDVQTLEGVEGGFDAAIGRLILMYMPDQVEALRQASVRLNPGGLLYLQEADLTYQWAAPPTPLWSRIHTWVLDTFERAGANARTGPSLFSLFDAAELPHPTLLVEAYAEGGADAPAWGWANVVTGIVPMMERLGVATKAQVNPATLADRLLAETTTARGHVIGPLFTSAWTSVP
ncbi:class I SAM-dependent methyltransferase [Spiractinospora alimapuensis]|uniref:class I SAM-dependent methyltransferase n=1 Tax=Spiractinospora alimapuensis TaxID=2820884 RepID=UPI001F183399|nr:class I SAM-dependent methyltransferase [Spiractinospora alimapuensis]QVQ50193.1 class I SAM-dependent methyltransferase [Spiractinospora alimapuensis]